MPCAETATIWSSNFYVYKSDTIFHPWSQHMTSFGSFLENSRCTIFSHHGGGWSYPTYTNTVVSKNKIALDCRSRMLIIYRNDIICAIILTFYFWLPWRIVCQIEFESLGVYEQWVSGTELFVRDRGQPCSLGLFTVVTWPGLVHFVLRKWAVKTMLTAKFGQRKVTKTLGVFSVAGTLK